MSGFRGFDSPVHMEKKNLRPETLNPKPPSKTPNPVFAGVASMLGPLLLNQEIEAELEFRSWGLGFRLMV